MVVLALDLNVRMSLGAMVGGRDVQDGGVFEVRGLPYGIEIARERAVGYLAHEASISVGEVSGDGVVIW